MRAPGRQSAAFHGPSPAATVARYHGTFNVVGGVWPLVHRRSFEWLLGPKHDYWLAQTVGALMAVNGVVQLSAGDDATAVAQARRIGMATSGVLLAIDLIYVPTGRIRWTYLLDAVLEAGWIGAWTASDYAGTAADVPGARQDAGAAQSGPGPRE
jgi:hypothetical protein